MINLSTKFEISMFIRYEDTKGNAKCRKWGGFWRLWVHKAHTISCLTLIETMHLSIII